MNISNQNYNILIKEIATKRVNPEVCRYLVRFFTYDMKTQLQDIQSKCEGDSENDIGIQFLFERKEHEPKVIKE